MLGAIIGDIAAWTYEHDRTTFWGHLVSEDAKVSEFGLSVITTTSLISTDPNMSKEEAVKFTRRCFRFISKDAAELSPAAIKWSSSLNCEYGSMLFGIAMLRFATCAFFDVQDKEMWFESTFDKEEGYTRLFLSKMVTLLWQGKTKDEVYEELGDVFKNCRHNWNWQEENGMLSYLLRAWDAFYRAFDFTSAIHNAMSMEGDKRLLGALTGAIASAMYGCRYRLIKEKYQKISGPPYEYIEWPEALKRHYIEEMLLLEKKAVVDRNFFPKNMALTNVERHVWVSMENYFADRVISKETKESLLYAYFPDWERRYQLYLENGWIYVCRSGFVLVRFQLQKLPDNTYRIWHTQRAADDTHNAEIAMREAIDGLCNDIDEKKKFKLWT